MSTYGDTLAKVRLEDGTVVYNKKGLSSIKPLCGGSVGDLRYKTCGDRSGDLFPTSLDIIIVITGFPWSRRVNFTTTSEFMLCR